MFLVSMCAGRC